MTLLRASSGSDPWPEQRRAIAYVLTGVFFAGAMAGYLWNQYRNSWGAMPRED